MDRRLVAALVLIGALLFMCWAAKAEEQVDVAMVTGLDISSSIDPSETKIQVDGLAAAMQSPEIIAAIQYGRRHRIAFAAYLWADAGCPMVVEWRIIASAEDAAAMAAELLAKVEAARATKLGSLTGLAGGMTCGLSMLQSSPFAADRRVLNIVSDGQENVRGETEVRAARDAAAAAGVTVNAMLLPDGTEGLAKLQPWYRANVISGPLSFIVVVEKAERMVDGWRRKFIGDMS